jgi:hypothetical protein
MANRSRLSGAIARALPARRPLRSCPPHRGTAARRASSRESQRRRALRRCPRARPPSPTRRPHDPRGIGRPPRGTPRRPSQDRTPLDLEFAWTKAPLPLPRRAARASFGQSALRGPSACNASPSAAAPSPARARAAPAAPLTRTRLALVSSRAARAPRRAARGSPSPLRRCSQSARRRAPCTRAALLPRRSAFRARGAPSHRPPTAELSRARARLPVWPPTPQGMDIHLDQITPLSFQRYEGSREQRPHKWLEIR